MMPLEICNSEREKERGEREGGGAGGEGDKDKEREKEKEREREGVRRSNSDSDSLSVGETIIDFNTQHSLFCEKPSVSVIDSPFILFIYHPKTFVHIS
jgi:hypothetical protein